MVYHCKTSFNCSTCYKNSTSGECLAPLQANADIVGTGFLTGFLFMACITMWSLVQSYLSNSLPETFLTDLDRHIIASYQSFQPWAVIKSAITAYWQLYLWIRHFIPPKPQKQPPESLNREKRMEIWLRFVVSLSDQQLCVGLAILVAAVANLCKLSVYELRVVNALSWFAATTHLVSLEIIKQYLYEHGIVREIRIVAMIINLILLMYIQIIITLIPRGLDLKAPIGCVPKFIHLLDDSNNIFTLFVVFLFLVASYTTRINQLYQRPETYGVHIGVWIAAMSLHIGPSKNGQSKAEMQRFLAIINHTPPTSDHDERLLSMHSPSTFVWAEYTESSISVINSSLYTLSYGIAQTTALSWKSGVVLTPESRAMQFGQIMPLFLLAIPLLTVVELYSEIRKAKSAGITSETAPIPHEAIIISPRTENMHKRSDSCQDDDSLYRPPTPPLPVRKLELTLPLVGIAPEVRTFYRQRKTGLGLLLIFVQRTTLLLFAGIITALRPSSKLRITGNLALILDFCFHFIPQLFLFTATKRFYGKFLSNFSLESDSDDGTHAARSRIQSTLSSAPETHRRDSNEDGIFNHGSRNQDDSTEVAGLSSDSRDDQASHHSHGDAQEAEERDTSVPESSVGSIGQETPSLTPPHMILTAGILAASPLSNRAAPSTKDLEKILAYLEMPLSLRSLPRDRRNISLDCSSRVNDTVDIDDAGSARTLHTRTGSTSSNMSGGNSTSPLRSLESSSEVIVRPEGDLHIQSPRRIDTEANIGFSNVP